MRPVLWAPGVSIHCCMDPVSRLMAKGEHLLDPNQLGLEVPYEDETALLD